MRLIAEIKLTGERLVPWSPPRSFLGGKPGGSRWHVHQKDKRLIAFQDAIRDAADAVKGPEPYCGPVFLSTTFTKGTADESLWGKRWWSAQPLRGHPDLTNLLKGAEDAIKTWRQFKMVGPKGAKVKTLHKHWPGVIEEDSQVCDGFPRKRWGPEDAVEIRIYAVED